MNQKLGKIGTHQPMQTTSTRTKRFTTVWLKSLVPPKNKSSLSLPLPVASSTKEVMTFHAKPLWHAITIKSRKMFLQLSMVTTETIMVNYMETTGTAGTKGMGNTVIVMVVMVTIQARPLTTTQTTLMTSLFPT